MTRKNSPFPIFSSSAAGPARGNATIYVLILVALFAALGFVVSRQNNSSETGGLSASKADIIAGQVMAYPAQVKQAVDTLIMSGVDPSDLDFTQPGQTGFDSDPTITKVFHPDGAGLSLVPLPAEAVNQTSTTPPAGWYLGRFNNVAWSTTSADDVLLVAYQLTRDICQRINVKLTGSASIPVLGDTIPDLFIDNEYPPGNIIHGGTNADLTTANCADCDGHPTLCVQGSSGRYGFYSMIINR